MYNRKTLMYSITQFPLNNKKDDIYMCVCVTVCELTLWVYNKIRKLTGTLQYLLYIYIKKGCIGACLHWYSVYCLIEYYTILPFVHCTFVQCILFNWVLHYITRYFDINHYIIISNIKCLLYLEFILQLCN